MTTDLKGPLAEHLATAAFFVPRGAELALPKTRPLEYIEWCEAREERKRHAGGDGTGGVVFNIWVGQTREGTQ